LTLAALLWPSLAFGQLSRFDTITLSPSGLPVSVNVSVCNSPGLITTAAQVTGNAAILTMASNPITAGFVANQSIVVSGFTGGDTYFNSGTLAPFTSTVTITAVSATTIIFPLTHANASAATNGSVFQLGTGSTPCAPLASIFSDAAGTVSIAQPGLTSSGTGNVGFFVAAGNYQVEYSGSTIGSSLQPLTLACPLTGACAFTGPQTVGKWNGNCIVDGTANATLAAAIICAGTSGVIEIPMFAMPSFTTATIPAGVTLKFDGPSCLNNSGTLTINGPIIAPPIQIFCGTGTIVLGTQSGPQRAIWFPGADIIAKMGNVYAALPTSPASNLVWVDPNPNGGCWTATSTVSFTRVNVYAIFKGFGASAGTNTCPDGGTTINYTPTSGAAITVDWTPLAGGGQAPGAGFEDIAILNNNCQTAAGCGGTATAFSVGTAGNGGMQAGLFRNIKVSGFQNCITVNNGTSWGMEYDQVWMTYCGTGLNYAQANEGFNWFGGGCLQCGTSLSLTNAFDAKFFGPHLDGSTTADVVQIGSVVTMSGMHSEDIATTNCVRWTNSGGQAIILGGTMLEDNATSNCASPWISGTGNWYIHGLNISSLGKTFTTLFSLSGTYDIEVINSSPTVLTPCPTFSTSGNCSEISTGARGTYKNFQKLGLGTSTGPYNLLPTAGSGGGSATFPNASGTVPFLGTAQTWTALNNFTGGLQVNGVSVAGLFTSTNVTPVTVSANTTGDQNLMAITITAGALNSISRTLLIQLAGVYSTPAGSTAVLTHKLKFCTVSGCGSGTVITLATWVTTALGAIQVTNDPYNVTLNASTQTAGASAAFEAHGNLTIDLSVLATAAESVFADNNTATVGTIDSTAQLFLQHTVAFSAGSASNTDTDRQMIADTVD